MPFMKRYKLINLGKVVVIILMEIIMLYLRMGYMNK